MSVQRQNFPTHINGEEIIKIVQGKKYGTRSNTFQGMLDRNEYLYNEEEKELKSDIDILELISKNISKKIEMDLKEILE